ncbi:hypothetical protein ABT186_18675 [Streptomyces sp. NPDC001634]|uniref:hypothetical protein n=1 Tax=Streptomyces sp. NPDC001634 TaxID=3154390 RepID=UPI00332F8669
MRSPDEYPRPDPHLGRDRVGRVRNPLGNLYWIQTRVEDVSPQEMERRLGEPEFTKAMEYVQSADFFSARASDLG